MFKWRNSALGAAALLAACDASVSGLALQPLALRAPDAVDFGALPTDEVYEASFELENVGEVAVEILAVVPATESPMGVTLTAELDAGVLPRGGRAEVVVRVIAEARPPRDVLGALTFDVAGLDPGDPRVPVVEVRGEVSVSGLVVEPNPLTIGPVPFTETGTGGMAIRNLRRSGGPVTAYAMRYADGRAQYDEAVTRGTFGPLPMVDEAGRIATLGPGERFDFELAYTAPRTPGEAKEQALWRVTACPETPEACAIDVVVQGLPDTEGPRAAVSPRNVSFGEIPVGNAIERRLLVSNQGTRPLVLEDVVLTGSPEIQVDVAPLEGARVVPGQPIQTVIRYQPLIEATHEAQLTFRTNDPLDRVVTVRISGTGVILPPCRFEASPAIVDFGVVELSEVAVEEVRIRNRADEVCVMFDPRIIPTEGTEQSTFAFEVEPAASFRLAPDEEVRLSIRFVPPSPGRRSAVLRLRTSEEEAVEVVLLGNTAEETSLICSPEQLVQVEQSVPLNARLLGGGAATYEWRVNAAPGAASWRLSPDTPTGPSADLTPLALGDYAVEVQVETEDGDSLSCTMRVTARSTGLLAIVFFFFGVDRDLHLRRHSAQPWFSADDCYFDNMRPLWVPGTGPGSGPNPYLDTDDVTGDGPENIRLDEPQLSVRYTLAVSHFERAAGRRARVQVSCGRATTVLDATSLPFVGQQTGNCSRNGFWTVAALTFFAPDQCAVEMIDAYQTTQDACQRP